MPQQPAIAESFGWCSPFVYIVFQAMHAFSSLTLCKTNG